MNTNFGDINILHQAIAFTLTNFCYFRGKKTREEKSPKRHKQCKSRMFSLVHIQIVIYLFLAEFQEVMHSLWWLWSKIKFKCEFVIGFRNGNEKPLGKQNLENILQNRSQPKSSWHEFWSRKKRIKQHHQNEKFVWIDKWIYAMAQYNLQKKNIKDNEKRTNSMENVRWMSDGSNGIDFGRNVMWNPCE